ncbi:MAG: tyrosine-type recombinase/integrase [Erythrobacter sp.]
MTDMKIEKITDKLIRSTKPPTSGQTFLREQRLTGFAVRITATGFTAFVLNYTVCGRERRITIGRHPAWTVAAAREEAKRLRRMIDVGEDPLEERNAHRSHPTLAEFYKDYEKEVLPTKAESTQRDEKAIWKRFLLPHFGSKRLVELTSGDVDRLHRRISQKTPVQANRVMAMLRKAYSVAIRWGLVEKNPVSGLTMNPEIPRERYLSAEEQRAFVETLSSLPETSPTLAIWFLLLTGARSGEVFSADWSQFDLDRAVWIKPSAHTKQKRTHRVPLSDPAVEVLKRAQKIARGEFVFATNSGKPISSIGRAFGRLCKQADIEDFRPHDLRHNYASLLASEGVSLQIIGKLLGHTQPATTNRYAHLADEPLRRATELAAKGI